MLQADRGEPTGQGGPPTAGPFRGFARELATPLALASIALLLCNDHLLKGSGWLPAALTGKLSDFAGLAFFPLLLFTLGDATLRCTQARSVRAHRVLALSCLLFTGLGFTLVKTSAAVNAAVSSFWGPMVLDPTDLIALVALVLPALQLQTRVALLAPASDLPARSIRAVGLVAAAAGSIATPQPPVRNYPVWELAHTSGMADCAVFTAWVSKSGKEGLGVTVEFKSVDSNGCTVEVVGAKVVVGDELVQAAKLPGVLDCPSPVHVYLPFVFDNERAWNEGRREGRLTLELRVRDRTHRWFTLMLHGRAP